MKKLIALAICGISLLAGAQPVMRYDRPAGNFNEALPLGNGTMGAMVYGRVENELVNLNEETLWGGFESNAVSCPDGPARLARIRELMEQGNIAEADELLMTLQGKTVQSYLPLGNLHIRQDFGGKAVEDYRMSLDLGTAVARTEFSVDGVTYTREFLISHPDRVMVIRLTSSQSGKLNFALDGDTPWPGCRIESVSDREFLVGGQLGPDLNSQWREPYVAVGPNGEKGMRYQYRVKATECDGEIYTAPGLRISEATCVTVIVSAATSFNGAENDPYTDGRDESAIAAGRLDGASGIAYETLKAAHVADYRSLFDRFKIDVGQTPEDIAALTTDKRLERYASGGKDPDLEEMYVQFGRYLLISSSRENSKAPANLQGIWCIDRHPAWGSNYTTNINLEMNYWPAEPLSLSELTAPLFRQIGRCSLTGKEMVRKLYGKKGWTIHHNSDIWGSSYPAGGGKWFTMWGNWPMGGAWLCRHLFEHYLYTGDKEFLRETAYPLMKGNVDFLMDWMYEKDGEFITAPATSPENRYFDADGEQRMIDMTTAMDLEICQDALTNIIKASEILGLDPDERALWLERKCRLAPLKIGADGRLQEWNSDWKDVEAEHRHVSHLYGLYPGNEISPLTTPHLADAARKTLEVRGDGGTGWSKAWKVCFWARLLDGDHSYKMLREQLCVSTLPNLFDTHPPFQIDGNFGSIAGVAEMFVQSQNDEIHILPALPGEWSEGSVSGIKARGGYSLDISWSEGRLGTAVVSPSSEGKCILRTAEPVKVKGASSSRTVKKDGWYLTTVRTKDTGKFIVTAL